jgi:putative endopeptidase
MLKAVWLSLSLCCLPALPQPGPNANVDSVVASPGPCDDFYQYACGPWLDANPIPKQEAAWGRFDELNERNTAILREILENSRAPEPGRSVTTRQIGDYYEACMNTSLIDQRGTAVLDDEMARISRIDSAKSILAEGLACTPRV